MSGRLILMGSGELAPAMVAVHRDGIAAAEADEVVVIDSPFGFQENVAQLTERIRHFFVTSLGVEVKVASYRCSSDGDTVRERFRATLEDARYVFGGPGSPSYALERWGEAGAAPILQRTLLGGGTVTLASAAAVTAGKATIPVYEIYKVGRDPFWADGLDLTAPYGFSLVAVPHWNNREGRDHDTSHCYIGTRRFEELRADLDVGVVGIDEHTAAVFDFASGRLSAGGVGAVTIEGRQVVRLESGASMALERLADLVGGPQASPPVAAAELPAAGVAEALAAHDSDALLTALLDLEARTEAEVSVRADLRTALARTVEAARNGFADPREAVGGLVEYLLELRGRARAVGDYTLADDIRRRLVGEGIEIRDTPDGTTWEVGPR